LGKFSADYKRRHYRAKDRNPEIELVDCETLNEDERFSVTKTDPVEIITKQELRDEVNAIVQSLPKELQDICHALLNGSNRRKIARDLNISKNTLYRRLETLQKVFSESGNKKISKFLQNLRDTFPKTADVYYRGED
jgi:DNA-directed RNA polymerase specialized sigma24 family protein